MRTINRPIEPPEILFSKEAEDARFKIKEFLKNFEIEGGQRRAPTFREILSDRQLVQVLYQDFGGVCAYCEMASPKPSADWVSHYRPTSLAVDASGRTSLIHYIWLTLEWQNIYHICPSCQKSRRNAFPTQNVRGRIDLTINELNGSERPEILDPCKDNIEEFFQCDLSGKIEVNYSLSDMRRGEVTLDLFKLNRPSVRQARSYYISNVAEALKSEYYRQEMTLAIESSKLDLLLLQDTDPTSTANYPCAGAVTSAILMWINKNKRFDFEGTSAKKFLHFLDDITEFERKEISERLINDIERKDELEKEEIQYKEFERFDYLGHRPSSYIAEDMHAFDKQISHISIRNYKSLVSVDFSLPESIDDEDLYRKREVKLVPCMMLLGENATGKTSALEAIAIALLGTTELGPLDKKLGIGTLQPDNLRYRESENDENSDHQIERAVEINIEYVSGNDSEHTKIESTIEHSAGETSKFVGAEFPSKIILAYGSRRYFGPTTRRASRSPVYRVTSLFNPIATTPSPKRWLLQCAEPQFNAAVRALREVLMLDEEYTVRRVGNAYFSDIVVETASGPTPLDELSMGYKTVVGMTIDIVRELFQFYDNTEFASAVVLIDEIETHLHPRWKMQIMRRLRLAFPNVQFIATTHDPLCLRGMYDGEVFVLRRSRESAHVEMLAELPSIRGMRAEQILTSEYFGLGSTDPETDARLARYHALVGRMNDLSTSESAELQELEREITDVMTVGSTPGQQIMFEAMRKLGFDPFSPIERVTGQTKKSMLSAALSALEGDAG